MDQTPKQQIIESLKTAESVVVTTSQTPTVDQAASVIALTEMLRDVEKKAVAAFDPSANEQTSFLEPGKFADPELATVRDFIVELDESNAKVDQFRYDRQKNKLRIYITPKQGSFSSENVKTTEGDFNVDTVITLGVSKQSDLFDTVARHNELVSKTKVLALSSGALRSNIPGATVWHDDDASSLAELLVGVGEALGADLNKQISTALLTGIMAETRNFTSDKTSPKVMTMAAQLMAAGANQQLIVKNLEQSKEEPDTALKTDQQPDKPSHEEMPQPPQKQVPAEAPPKEVSESTPPQEPTNQHVQQSQTKAPQAQQQQHEQPLAIESQPSPAEQSQPASVSQQMPEYTKPDSSQEFSVNSQGQIVSSPQPHATPQERPKPPEPKDVLQQEQTREQSENVSRSNAQIPASTEQPQAQEPSPQNEDTPQGGSDTLNQARSAVDQALSGSGDQQATPQPPQQPNQGGSHPMIKTDRAYNMRTQQNHAKGQNQPENPFNSADESEEGNGNNNPIL